MNSDKSTDLKKIFLNLQEQMIAKLQTDRNIINHPGAKGDATELCWLDMLQSYLPKRYQAEKAFVIDSKSQLSDQIDVVIFDRQYSPFLFNQDETFYVPAESVYAVFEIKQTLSKECIEYASDKAASVRRLYRTNAPIYHAGGLIHKPKKPFNILAGLLTLDTDVKTVDKAYIKNKLSTNPLKRLEMFCVLSVCGFSVEFQEDNRPNVLMSNKENSLIFFFLQLLAKLQKLGTVPAIEIDKYADSIN